MFAGLQVVDMRAAKCSEVLPLGIATVRTSAIKHCDKTFPRCSRNVLRSLAYYATRFKIFTFRPPVRSNGRSYKMLVMFFFRHAFSEFLRPIALKLCHLIGICVYFIMQVQKLGGHSPQKNSKHAKFRSILDHFRL